MIRIRREHPGFMVYVGNYACKYVIPPRKGRFGNGSHWCSGWHYWPEELEQHVGRS